LSAHHPFSLLSGAVGRRGSLLRPDLTAVRLFDGAGDGLPGLSVDRLGAAAIVHVDDDAGLPATEVTRWAQAALDVGSSLGVRSAYVKARPRDRSRLGAGVADESRSPAPRAGVPQPPALVVREYDSHFEVHPYDGLSTGLFLEHRDHRRAVAERPAGRALNLFAYTCAFAVPLAVAGWDVTNVDVSGSYLDWGRRNLALNGLESTPVRFLRRDAMSYLTKAAMRLEARYDLVILDPPTFGATDRRRGIHSWRAVDDYPALIRAAVAVLTPEGVVFAATNTRALAAAGVLERLVSEALGVAPRWLSLPPWPLDVTERGRVAAVLFAPRH
jgi:23S rRNA (cytosine1962-C5)-methyltransferase